MNITRMELEKKKDPFHKLIIAVSVVIPVVVAALFGIKIPASSEADDNLHGIGSDIPGSLCCLSHDE